MTISLPEIRIAEENDLPHLLALYGQLQPDDSVLSSENAHKIWRQQYATSQIIHLVAIIDKVIIGASTLIIIPNLTRGGRPFAIIENVIVDALHRKKRAGKALMNASLEYARQHDCYKVMLQSNLHRTDAHQFYAATGFDGESKRAFEVRM